MVSLLKFSTNFSKFYYFCQTICQNCANFILLVQQKLLNVKKTFQQISFLGVFIFVFVFSNQAIATEITDSIQKPTIETQIGQPHEYVTSNGDIVRPKDEVLTSNPPKNFQADTLDFEDDDDFFMDGESAAENEILPLGEMLREFIVPFQGRVTSRFGMRRRRMHMGTDIKVNLGDTVVAAYHGVVKMAQPYFRYGKLVIIQHPNNLETYYSHFSKILVNEGDTVFAGQPVGLGGRTGRATGVHLHFEIRQNGKAFNPELIFDFENNLVRNTVNHQESLAEIAKNSKGGAKNVAGQESSPRVHIVRRGDTLGEIARRYRTTVSKLTRLNNINSTTILRVGMRLRLN